MKKAISLVLVIIFATSLFSCKQDNDHVDDPQDSTIQAEHILTLDAPNDLFVTVQGAIFDGEYYYVAFINNYLPIETAIIVKADKEGNEVKRSEILPLDHANSITLLRFLKSDALIAT